MSRFNTNNDENQPEIIGALLNVGAVVEVLSDQGNGITDLLVGWRRRLFLLEVKNPTTENPAKPEKALTKAQRVFHAKWRGFPVFIVFTPQEALEAIGAA